METAPSKTINKVTVFCAASLNVDRYYLKEASKLGTMLAESGKQIIYGGGKVGLMGALADAALESNGLVTGIIPEFMQDLELGHQDIDMMIEVGDMHSREAYMMTQTDAILALPGGIGTFSELLQSITWKRLGQIDKNTPIIIVNMQGYFDPMIAILNQAIDQGFLRSEFADIWTVVETVDQAIALLMK